MPSSYERSRWQDEGRHPFMVRVPLSLWRRLKHQNADRDEPMYLTVETVMERGLDALEGEEKA